MKKLLNEGFGLIGTLLLIFILTVFICCNLESTEDCHKIEYQLLSKKEKSKRSQYGLGRLMDQIIDDLNKSWKSGYFHIIEKDLLTGKNMGEKIVKSEDWDHLNLKLLGMRKYDIGQAKNYDLKFFFCRDLERELWLSQGRGDKVISIQIDRFIYNGPTNCLEIIDVELQLQEAPYNITFRKVVNGELEWLKWGDEKYELTYIDRLLDLNEGLIELEKDRKTCLKTKLSPE